MTEQEPPKKPKPEEKKKKKKRPEDEEEEDDDLETADELGDILNKVKNPQQITKEYRQKGGQ